MIKIKSEPPAKILTCTFPEISGMFCQLNYGDSHEKKPWYQKKIAVKIHIIYGSSG